MSCGATDTIPTLAGICPGTPRGARMPGVLPHGSPPPATVGPRSPGDTGGTVPGWVAAQQARVLAQRWSVQENVFPMVTLVSPLPPGGPRHPLPLNITGPV